MSDIVKFIKSQDDDVYELYNQKKKLESQLYEINEKIYHSCNHVWIHDIIENPYNEKLTNITYCKYCELHKR